MSALTSPPELGDWRRTQQGHYTRQVSVQLVSNGTIRLAHLVMLGTDALRARTTHQRHYSVESGDLRAEVESAFSQFLDEHWACLVSS